MKTLSKSLTCVTLCGLISVSGAAPVLARPAGLVPFAVAGYDQTVVEQVQYRGNRRSGGYGRGRGYGGGGLALGIGAAIIGGIILSEAARADHRNLHGDDWDRCAQTYRSFEPNTGMYTSYDGRRRTCPFLH